jgi:hypothetical protein
MWPDPVSGSTSDPQSLNRYAYSLNDPINLSDPTGLMPYLNDPYAWMTNASVHGPGYYIDGFELLGGQEGLIDGLIGSGAAVYGPIGARAYSGSGGASKLFIQTNTGKGLQSDGSIHLGVTGIEVTVVDQGWSAEQWELWAIAYEASLLLKKEPCAQLLSSDIGNPYINTNYVGPGKVLEFFQNLSAGKQHSGGLSPGKPKSATAIAETDGMISAVTIVFASKFFKDVTVGGWTRALGLSRRDVQKLIVLHELGHATGAAAANHYNAPSQGATKKQIAREDREATEYNKKIKEACF